MSIDSGQCHVIYIYIYVRTDLGHVLVVDGSHEDAVDLSNNERDKLSSFRPICDVKSAPLSPSQRGHPRRTMLLASTMAAPEAPASPEQLVTRRREESA